mmetsp:Transcript_57754/g.66433  ORF Transcript_57754/g.66433 Transcript_57754/m.66433 type:complete len:216 (+) Transcript_57754:1612-2259(+)
MKRSSDNPRYPAPTLPFGKCSSTRRRSSTKGCFFARINSPADTNSKFSFSAARRACVDFPEPRGPRNSRTIGCCCCCFPATTLSGSATGGAASTAPDEGDAEGDNSLLSGVPRDFMTCSYVERGCKPGLVAAYVGGGGGGAAANGGAAGKPAPPYMGAKAPPGTKGGGGGSDPELLNGGGGAGWYAGGAAGDVVAYDGGGLDGYCGGGGADCGAG